MENIENVKRGIAAFVDAEMFPVMPKTKGIMFSAFAPIWLETKGTALLKSPLLTDTGLVENEEIDVDKIYQAVKAKAAGNWPIEYADFKFSENDFDKLYRYVKGE